MGGGKAAMGTPDEESALAFFESDTIDAIPAR